MNKALLILISLFSTIVNAQFIPVLIRYDNVETYNWFGAWLSSTNSGYYTNASVSPTASAVTYGVGSSSSIIEQNLYVLPNITGLDVTKDHLFKFRLGAYRFSSLNSTRGVDVGDYVEVRISTDGEISYIPELRITGFSNAYWDYNNTTITKTADGTNTRYTPASGGNRTSAGDGYSIIELIIPAGINQIAVDIYCRANSAGEEWWLDNMELFVLEPDVILSIELNKFSGTQIPEGVLLEWVTSQEFNNSHFIIERSFNLEEWDSIQFKESLGDGGPFQYQMIDSRPFSGINYYRLAQYDFDGTVSYSKNIAVEYKLRNIHTYAYQSGNTVYLKNYETFTKFKLIDVSGKVIKEERLDQKNYFETSEISSGTYYINFTDDEANTAMIKVRILN